MLDQGVGESSKTFATLLKESSNISCEMGSVNYQVQFKTLRKDENTDLEGV